MLCSIYAISWLNESKVYIYIAKRDKGNCKYRIKIKYKDDYWQQLIKQRKNSQKI